MESFVRALPKAELHLHIEGTLEPELLFELARRNRVALRHESVEELGESYRFADLAAFLQIFYQGAAVLRDERDFFDLTWAYLRRAQSDGVRHAEIFFDPQTHTGRGVPFEAVVDGIVAALEAGRRELAVTSQLILCFLRDRGADEAMATLEQARSRRERFVGVGLDSAEVGHPPEDFTRVFDRARADGLRVVAHAGEEGPPAYIWQALDRLSAERIDHGVRAIEDPALLERLVRERIPLTVCPLSNVRLGVVASLEEHPLRRLFDAGVLVTINSDDPAYFGGYVGDNYAAVASALGFDKYELGRIAATSFEASFIEPERRHELLGELADFLASALQEG